MERYVTNLKGILKENANIDELPLEDARTRQRALTILLKVNEWEEKDVQVSAIRLREECGIAPHFSKPIRDWLEQHGYLTVDKIGRRKWIRVTEKGIEALDRRHMIGRLEEYSKLLYDARSFEQEMEGLYQLFGEVFEYAWKRFKRYRDIKDYNQFLGAIEGSAYNYLNQKISRHIEEIMKGNLGGYLEDPYFSIQSMYLPALYYDAVLAFRLGHYLTDNHRFVLEKAGDVSSEELIQHNNEWVRRFVEDEIPGEFEPHADQWRLLPVNFVMRERKIREKHVLPPELRRNKNGDETYGERFSNSYAEPRERSWSRNNFNYDPRWYPDIDKTERNYEIRKMIRKIQRFGPIPDILSELADLTGSIPKPVKQQDGSWVVECIDRERNG